VPLHLLPLPLLVAPQHRNTNLFSINPTPQYTPYHRPNQGRTSAPAKTAGAFSCKLAKQWRISCLYIRQVSTVAIYHLSVKRIGGNSGRSSVGAAAYHAGKKYRNECDGVVHDYAKRRGSDYSGVIHDDIKQSGAVRTSAYHSGKKLNEHDFTQKSDIIHNEIMLPKHAPEIFKDGEVLWNSVESAKKQRNEQTARMIVVALPNELSFERNIEMLRGYIRREFVDDGMCADFSVHAGHIHDRKDEIYPFQDLAIRQDNPHAHIQLTTRPLNEDGTWANKTKKEYILDKNGNRIRTKDGKSWRSRNINLTDWEKPETLIKWRKGWADAVNREFERLGINERISHETLEKQGIDREPTTHMGYNAWNLEKKGIKTDVGNRNREIMIRNKMREVATREIAEIEVEKHVALAKVEDIEEQVIHIHELKERIAELEKERQAMGFFAPSKTKKAIYEKMRTIQYSREQAETSFKQTYEITPEIADVEIRRLKYDVAGMERKQKQIYARLLMDIARDKQRERARLEHLEREARDYQQGISTREYLAGQRRDGRIELEQTQRTKRRVYDRAR